jgi:hypothetical protein
MSSARELEAMEAEVTYYRDSVALARARLYRRGGGTTPRFEELQRRLNSAQQRLRTARAVAQPEPEQRPVRQP